MNASLAEVDSERIES